MTSIIINKVIDRVIHVLERWRGTPHIPDWYYREEAEWERVNKCGETSAASSDCPRCSGLEEKVKKHNADYDGLQLIIERQNGSWELLAPLAKIGNAATNNKREADVRD